MTELKFRKGDVVMYIGEKTLSKKGKVYTIAGIHDSSLMQYSLLEDIGFVPFESNLILFSKDNVCTNCRNSCKSGEIKECPLYQEDE